MIFLTFTPVLQSAITVETAFKVTYGVFTCGLAKQDRVLMGIIEIDIIYCSKKRKNLLYA